MVGKQPNKESKNIDGSGIPNLYLQNWLWIKKKTTLRLHATSTTIISVKVHNMVNRNRNQIIANYLPEPADLLIFSSVASIFSMCLPILYID